MTHPVCESFLGSVKKTQLTTLSSSNHQPADFRTHLPLSSEPRGRCRSGSCPISTSVLKARTWNQGGTNIANTTSGGDKFQPSVKENITSFEMSANLTIIVHLALVLGYTKQTSINLHLQRGHLAGSPYTTYRDLQPGHPLEALGIKMLRR